METLVIKVSEHKKVRMLVEMLKSMDFIASVDLMGDKKADDQVSDLEGTTTQPATAKVKLSDKYGGILSKEEGKKLNEYVEQMRNEWN